MTGAILLPCYAHPALADASARAPLVLLWPRDGTPVAARRALPGYAAAIALYPHFETAAYRVTRSNTPLLKRPLSRGNKATELITNPWPQGEIADTALALSLRRINYVDPVDYLETLARHLHHTIAQDFAGGDRTQVDVRMQPHPVTGEPAVIVDAPELHPAPPAVPAPRPRPAPRRPANVWI